MRRESWLQGESTPTTDPSREHFYLTGHILIQDQANTSSTRSVEFFSIPKQEWVTIAEMTVARYLATTKKTKIRGQHNNLH